MAQAELVELTIGTSEVTRQMPGGRYANVQCSAAITIAFWNPAANSGQGDFGAAEALGTPGGPVFCPNDKARLTSVAGADITVSLLTP